MKKRILFVNHSLQQGGIVRSLIAALRSIDPEKYDVTVYVHRDQLDLADLLPSYVNVIVNHDANHYYRRPKAALLQVGAKLCSALGAKKQADRLTDSLNRFVRSQKVLHPQKDYFRDREFDTVISYSVDICTEIALAIPAKKHIAFFHSSKIGFHLDMTSRCYPLYDRIVAVSSGVEEVLRSGFPELGNKIVCLQNYVDGKHLLFMAHKERVYPDGDLRLRLCSCGRLSREKGFDLAVEAGRILRDKDADFVWYFVGDGEQRRTLEAKIAEYGLSDRFVITGFLMNPYPYIDGCDIYVQPSYEEAQPLAVMEAQILGKAIVSTETVGGKTILENGRKGILTPIDAEGLAAGIAGLLEDPAKRASFEDLYSAEDDLKAKREYAAAWDRLLSE